MTEVGGGGEGSQASRSRRRPARPDAFEALFDDAPCGYLTMTDSGRITRANATFLSWSGYHRDEIVGTAFSRLLPVGDRILWAAHSTPQIRTAGSVSEVVVEIVGGDRVRRPALVTAVRVAPPVVVGQSGALGVDEVQLEPEVRVIVFSAPERRAHERELIEALHRAEESEDRRAAVELENRRLARWDPLTGLANRAGLSAHLQELPDAGDTVTAVLVVDLDHFTVVNESLGSTAGDDLLNAVAGRLRGGVREEALVARSSADEFVVVTPCQDLVAAAALAERLLLQLTAPVVLAGLEIVTSASIGVAVAAPVAASAPVAGRDVSRAERALHDAGVAMQRAKARGRARVEVHDPAVTGQATQRLRRLGELRRGIAAGELRLHYQPQVRLSDGRLSGVEALVRWQHPVHGLLPPSEFIDIAESSGLVRELGAWVLDAAVSQAAQWAVDPASTTVEISVNLSTRQLTDPGLVPSVIDALTRHQLPAHLLVVEVTETALVTDPDAAAATLAALKELGVGISVDDFGTGYASLTYLQRFPVDELKIDRSFVAGLVTAPGDTAIVAACVQLAHAVGVRAVAEGIETDEQRLALSAMGCDVGQGYFFARPLEAVAVQSWARQQRVQVLPPTF